MPPGLGPAARLAGRAQGAFSIDPMLEYTLKTYQSPTRLVQRLGAIKELGTEAGLLGMRRPLLVTDAGVKRRGSLTPRSKRCAVRMSSRSFSTRSGQTRASSWSTRAPPNTARRAATGWWRSAAEARWTQRK